MTDNWIWLCDEAYQVVNMTSNTFQIESNTACASIYKLRCMASKIFSVQAKVRRQLFRKDYQLKTVTILGFIHIVRLVFQTYLWSSVCAYKQNYMLYIITLQIESVYLVEYYFPWKAINSFEDMLMKLHLWI